MRILFVCTGNTCRSPMAAAIAEDVIARADIEAEVASAGVHARSGDRATEFAQLVAAEHGLDLSTHRAQRLTPEIAESADLVIAMTEQHADAAAELGARRVVMIGPVEDPMGGDLDAYRETFSMLAARIPDALVR